MKQTYCIVIMLIANLVCYTQQLNSTSFYELYGTLHNPATVGSRHHASIGSSFKTQWSSMPGSPKTALIYGQAYLSNAKIGLGGYLFRDVTGPISQTGFQTSYAYHIPLQKESSLSIGLEARLQQLSFDVPKLQQVLSSTDPVASSHDTRFKGDAGVGIAYTSPSFQIGASVSQLMQSKLNLYEVVGTTNEQSKFYRHYYLHGYYNWQADEDTKIIPNILLIYLPNAPAEIQAGARVDYNNLLWYGLSWRVKQGWMIAAGFKVKQKLSIGYSFDIYTAPLSIYESGSNGHELIITYEFLK